MDVNVSLAQKYTLQPKDSAFMKVKNSFMDMSSLDKNFNFISSYMNDNLEAQGAIVSFATEPRGHIENLSPNHIHINKNTKLGIYLKLIKLKRTQT